MTLIFKQHLKKPDEYWISVNTYLCKLRLSRWCLVVVASCLAWRLYSERPRLARLGTSYLGVGKKPREEFALFHFSDWGRGVGCRLRCCSACQLLNCWIARLLDRWALAAHCAASCPRLIRPIPHGTWRCIAGWRYEKAAIRLLVQYWGKRWKEPEAQELRHWAARRCVASLNKCRQHSL